MTPPPPQVALDGTALAAARRRARWLLAAGVALTSIGNIAAFTVVTIAAEALLGDAGLSGLPAATYVLGSAAGSIGLSYVMSRATRRLGLTLGYLASAAGALLSAAGITVASFPLLLVGMALIGTGNGGAQLARYAAADLVPPARRASAIGLVVWASTVGSIVGPPLVEPAGRLAVALGLPILVGAYLVPLLFVGIAAVGSFALLRPDPYELAAVAPEPASSTEPVLAPLREILARPMVVVAIGALIAAQFTMVLIMTMTPLHMTTHGHGLGAVGLVLSAHTLGMYGLAPLSGMVAQRLGALRTVFLGTAVLVGASILAATAPPEGGLVLAIALFLLGYGWSLGFVAGSTMLSAGLRIAERTRVQGIADALIWTTAAIASVGSGLVLRFAGYTTLGLLGAAVVILPLWLYVSRRSAIRTALPQPSEAVLP